MNSRDDKRFILNIIFKLNILYYNYQNSNYLIHYK